MADFVAYYESSAGHYMPMIARDSGGEKEYRDITREDIRRIEDQMADSSADDGSGGWLYKKGQGARASWSKRYMIVKGQYLFYFHGPQNDKPVGVIPVENCEIILPPDNGKSFSGNRFFRANDGFEFEISHMERRAFQLYATTEHDRAMWVQKLTARTGRRNGVPGYDSHTVIRERTASIAGGRAGMDGTSNVAITSTKLGGSNTSSAASMGGYAPASGLSVADPFAPPPPPVLATGKPGGSIEPGGASDVSAAALAAISQRSQHLNKPLAFNSPALVPGLKKSDIHMHVPITPELSGQSSGEKLECAIAYSFAQDDEMKKNAQEERTNLEKDLQDKFRVQQEGRRREAQARERNMSKQRLEAARVLEMRNPMTLAELFRCLMFFVDEDLCEEPARDTPLQFPHLKGEWTENMMVSVYQRYCRTTGFMSLEEFVEFMEDFAVLQTHCPHDDNDDPMPEFLAQLDPVRLLTTIPRNLGYSRDMEANLRSGHTADDFNLNFAQFYQLLLRITHICYADIYEANPVAAFNKILQESILPLYAWSQGHSKRGSSDPLVTEERIALLMVTYAPNLWKVFLMYCQNYQAKIPDMTLSYPEATKTSEQILFGYPFNAHLFRRKTNASTPNVSRGVGGINPAAVAAATDEASDKQNAAFFITEAGCVRFALDYGIVPHLVSKKEIKEMFAELNKSKMLYIVKPATQANPPTVYYQKTQTTLRREHGAFTSVEKSDTEHPMYFGFSDKMRSPGASSPTKKSVLKSTINSGTNGRLKVSGRAGVVSAIESGESSAKLSGGLGFSEFIEFVAKIAVVGMDSPNYHILFPTPFSKVLAMLMVWGIADVKKLDEVRAIRSEMMQG